MNSMLMRQGTYIAVLLLILTGCGAAQASIDTRPVVFEPGRSGAMIESSVRGDRMVDYVVTGVAGQYMTVDIDSDHSANYFNVMAPGDRDQAVFTGSSEGRHFEGALAADGDYTIRVYLMRSAARRDEQANFTLNIAVTTVDEPVDRGIPVSGSR